MLTSSRGIDSQKLHICAFCGFESGRCIFENEAMLRMNPEFLSSEEITIRSRLALLHILCGDEKLGHWDAGGPEAGLCKTARAGWDNSPTLPWQFLQKLCSPRDGGHTFCIVDFVIRQTLRLFGLGKMRRQQAHGI